MSITETIPNFSGGLCSTPSELVDCATLTNMLINRDGSVQGRSGYSALGSGMTGYPIALICAPLSSGTKTVAQGTTKMWWLNGTTWTAKGTFAATAATLGSMCQFGNYIVACSPAYSVIYWDGGAGNFTSVSSGPTNALTVISDQNYVYCTDQNNTLRYSASGDCTSWPAGNVLTVGGERDTIHDMAFLFDQLYLFRESGIWRKTGSAAADFALTKLSNDRCFSKVAAAHNGIYVMNAQGIQIFDGSTCRRISAKIDDSTFIPNSNGQFMYYHFGQRKLYVPQTAGVYVYDELLDRWALWTISGFQCAIEIGPASGLYFGTSGYSGVYTGWTGTTDAGSAITTTLATKTNIDFGSPEMLKRPKHLYIDGTLTSCTVTLKSNYGATTEQTFTSPGRINFCAPTGTPQRNFQVSISGVQGTVLRSMKLVAHPVTI